MSSYGLKTNIALNISILLFCGMFLTAFMLTSLFQKLLLNLEVKKGLYTASVLEEVLCSKDNSMASKVESFHFKLRTILLNSDVSAAVVVFPDTKIYHEFGESDEKIKTLKVYAKKAFKLAEPEVDLTGGGWGVFWKHKTELLVSAPIYQKNEKVAGLCLLIPLSKMFLNLRKLMKIIFIYILINAGILTIIGVYQISKSVVKPIHRLLKRADDYRNDNSAIIFEEKTGNEFQKLSGALNNMLGRISDDKAKLQVTVESLEVANTGLKNAQKEIVRAEKLASVGRLASGIAHEIGNPLGIVGGYLELMKDGNHPQEQKDDFIERAEKELNRIDGIIRQLLDYSRKSKETATLVYVDKVIVEVVEMVRIQPFMKNISIESSDIQKEIPVIADHGQLKQVFLNLIMNAADALNSLESDRDCVIKVKSEQIDSDVVRIIIEDNGPGISPEDIGNVFDPFFTTKEPGKGTGLGLSVCFKIIEDFEGRLTVVSKEGLETEIRIDLPMANKTKT